MTISKDAYEAMVRDDLDEFKRLVGEHSEAILGDGGGTFFLHHAAGRGRLKFVQLLVQHGIDVNVPRDEDDFEGPIIHAAAEGHLDVVRWLFDQGARVNSIKDDKTWCSALTLAIAGGHMEMVKLLVERGADVNAPGPGLTPLGYALAYNYLEIAEYLQSVGAKLPDKHQ
jgi:ankyrin repeat protein